MFAGEEKSIDEEQPISMEDLQQSTPVPGRGTRRCLELDSDPMVFGSDEDESRDVLSPLGEDHHRTDQNNYFPTATFPHVESRSRVMMTPKESLRDEKDADQPMTPGEEKEGDISNGSTAVGATPTPLKEACAATPSTPARAQTLVIFDWDDTICPTTWAKLNGLNVCDPFVPEQFIDPLAELAEMAAKMVRVAASLGKVVIVTNAQDGWFELSCRKWLPSLEPLLQDLAVQICSARSAFEHTGIKSPAGWKAHAFRDIIDGQRCATPVSGSGPQFLEQPSSTAVNFWNSSAMHRSWRNVISIGDSPHEREALMRVTLGNIPTRRTANSWMKSVKFLLKPDLTQLGNEIQLLTESLEHIVKHDGALDLELLTNEAAPPQMTKPIERREEPTPECAVDEY
ncbi:hypothetical protein FOL47_002617 [Perkinsus chesapeaki]|uniref:Uncharacterized protein n=1 Tax=Perkinsus chesapeaki TaxID=330153 RepID=A0A7J6MCL2_PERCH|nr:hypothetical protein FOL47_002617 [Perkinsus chesapeaki]